MTEAEVFFNGLIGMVQSINQFNLNNLKRHLINTTIFFFFAFSNFLVIYDTVA